MHKINNMKEKVKRNIQTPKEIKVIEYTEDNFKKYITNILNKLRQPGIHKTKVCYEKELEN